MANFGIVGVLSLRVVYQRISYYRCLGRQCVWTSGEDEVLEIKMSRTRPYSVKTVGTGAF
jgi:hypothetical protein